MGGRDRVGRGRDDIRLPLSQGDGLGNRRRQETGLRHFRPNQSRREPHEVGEYRRRGLGSRRAGVGRHVDAAQRLEALDPQFQFFRQRRRQVR